MTVTDTEGRRRVATIASYAALDDAPRPELVSLVTLAAQVCDVPRATLEMVADTEDHQVAAVGIETSASRLIAAQPLVSPAGVQFGALRVFDEVPRDLDASQLDALALLADRVVDHFELRLRTRQLTETLAQVEALRAEVERASQRLVTFAGQVCHDLKTPLTSISLSLELIQDQLEQGDDDLDPQVLIEKALNGTARANELIETVHAYAQVGVTPDLAPVDLGRLLAEVRTDLSDDLAGADVHAGALPMVQGDATQLHLVLQHLLGNAAKFADPGRPLQLTVSARQVPHAWRIELADNGRGVPEAKREAIFAPLVRVDKSVPGSGMGLAVSRRIIEAHGGTIGMEPRTGEGSVFWFELPDRAV